VIFLPFLGVLIYLIAEGSDMGHRDLQQQAAARADFEAYVRRLRRVPEGPLRQVPARRRLRRLLAPPTS
jgi:hypothetical protein